MTEPLVFHIGLKSDIGQKRSLNEDCAAEIPELPNTQAAFVLCDGMGGLRAGDVASREAVNVVAGTLRERFRGAAPQDPLAELTLALTRANAAVNDLQAKMAGALGAAAGAPGEKPVIPGAANALMGSTCVAGVVVNDELYLAHAGDSRAYLYRGGKLTRLTDDHSYVAERVRAGDISEAEARVSRYRNMITRAIGIEPTVEPDLRREHLEPGDMILVCSDGLTTMVEDAMIVDLLRQNPPDRMDTNRLAQSLIDLANRSGGHDNTTVLVLRAHSPGDAQEEVQPSTVSSVPAPRKRPAQSAGAAPPRGAIVDIDAPRSLSRRRAPGEPAAAWGALPLLTGGALALLLLAMAVLGVGGIRRRAAVFLAGDTAPAAASGGAAAPAVDYQHLQYDPAVRLSTLLARGDQLSYSKAGGLLFIHAGTVMTLSAEGKPIRPSLAVVPVQPPQNAVSPSHVFLATDPHGDIYLSSPHSQTIQKLSPDGKPLLTLQGFDRPEAITVDDNGNLYVVDANLIKVLRAHAAASKGSTSEGAAPGNAALVQTPAGAAAPKSPPAPGG